MIDQKIITQLVKLLGEASVKRSPEDLAVYGYDGTFEDHRPELVILPRTTEEVSQVVALAAAGRIPLVTRGMGSGLSCARRMSAALSLENLRPNGARIVARQTRWPRSAP